MLSLLIFLVAHMAPVAGIRAAGVQAAAGQTTGDAGAAAAPDTTWTTYTVRPGDTLFAISRLHDVPVDTLRAWNAATARNLRAGTELRVGYELPDVAPDPVDAARPVDVEQLDADSTRLTLLDVVSSYGLADSLRAWQPDAAAWLAQTAVERTTAERPPRIHVVTAGETLFGVSRTYGVDSDRLREANNMTGTGLRIGQELRIPGSDGSVTASGLDVLPPVHEIVSVLAWPSSFDGQQLSSGGAYDPADWLAGHGEWPLGAVLLIENPANGRMAVARVADRTPGAELGILDVSRAVYEALGLECVADSDDTAASDRGTAVDGGTLASCRVRVRLLPWSVSQ